MLTACEKYASTSNGGGELCMKGGIYSSDKCPICGGRLIDNGSFVGCPFHKQIRAINLFVKFDNIFKRFKEYSKAARFLNGLRFKTDESTFDERDYRRDNPLGFTNASEKFLEYAKPKTAHNMRPHIRHAQGFFENRNVKYLKCGDFEDLLKGLELSDKTKNNIVGTLKVFYRWMKRRQDISEIPEFPKVDYVLGYRKTVDKDTQRAIIEEVKRIAPARVYLGIKWLATYFSVRPAEMINLKEGEIDIGNGYLYFPHPKERSFKSVPILPEDTEILRNFKQAVPELRFFRHDGGLQGTRKDEPFGEKYFYKWWRRACDNLNIIGVDLYAGTRHSTVRALRPHFSPEQLKRAAMSRTNKAFDRYFGQDSDMETLTIYGKGAEVIPFAPELHRKIEGSKNDK